MDVEGGTSWVWSASLNGSVDGSTKTADGVSPGNGVWLTRDVVNVILSFGGVSRDACHGFMRKKLLAVMERHPAGLD